MKAILTVVVACVAFSGIAQSAMLDLQPQIDAAAARGGGTVCVPVGEHETKPFELRSNVTLELASGARILASTNIADYANAGVCGFGRAADFRQCRLHMAKPPSETLFVTF